MNSFTGNSSSQKTPSPSTFSSYQFDFGFGSSNRNSIKPLRDEKSNPASAYTAPRPAPATPSWAPQPNKPSWIHQPAPAFAPSSGAGLSGPASMVGDILGKSWSSAAPAPAPAPAPGPATSSIGIPKSNPNLFGDLVGSALNQGKNSGNNVPLKAAPARNSYSMGNLADPLPKSSNNNNENNGSTNSNSTKQGGGSSDNFGNLGSNGNNSSNSVKSNWESAENFGSFSSANQPSKPFGGQPMKSMSGAGLNPKQDPFGSLMNFGSKNSGNPPINTTNTKNSGTGGGLHSSFGAFQNAKPADFGMPIQKPEKTEDSSFGEFKNAERNDFGIQSQPQTKQPASDPMDSLFSSLVNSSDVSGSQQFGEMNDWDVGAEFGGGDHSVTTTELEGLPPPPSGVTFSVAKTKGMDNYKQGQYADAIKWLSWAVVLVEKNGESAEADEVLTCRASCYKEVGEYKKAVADCSKVLERDGTNVSVLLQRALLYESTEKYRLGADDLRTVLKIDPSNRLAKSTIHRLNKMAD